MSAELKVDFCSYEAAKWAVEHWHYSKQLPVGKSVNIGAWEQLKFVGAIHFRNGANRNMSSPYGLTQWECIELARVALGTHISPVSQIVTMAIRLLKSHNPNLRLIVSFADPAKRHLGIIYQAMNWIYAGETGEVHQYCVGGKWYHQRSVISSDWSKVSGIDYKKLPRRNMPGKHRYLYPLDRAMRRQIEPLAKPYPKRDMRMTNGSAPAHQPGSGDSISTRPLFEPAS